MEITTFLARFWGSLFMILGGLSVGSKLLGRVIGYTEDRAITIATGYITFLLGLMTVVAYNIWVRDWSVAITLLGWVTLLKGVERIGLPDRVRAKAKIFEKTPELWGVVIFLIGVGFFYLGW